VAAYLTLDAGRIPGGWIVGNQGGGAAIAQDLYRQGVFFLLEAGFTGIAILAIRRSSAVVLALAILALLPAVRFGAANDLVMRASIPSLAVLAIGASFALTQRATNAAAWRNKVVLGGLLAVGAVTPLQEFARAATLRSWPIDLQTTLIGAACGRYPAHYVAALSDQAVRHLLRRPRPLPLEPRHAEPCENPAADIMKERGLL
jgi:hypothetical protein